MREPITTRVCIDDFGPFECKLSPGSLWNGFLSPHFSLAVAREVSAGTIRSAEEIGYACQDTVHVIDGRADGPHTVHVFDSGLTRIVNDWGDREPVTVAVRVPWSGLDRGEQPTISTATPAARKAARKSARKAARLTGTGRGQERAVIVHLRWQHLVEGSTTAAEIIEPDADGLYCIGGWEWCWGYSHWWCACGSAQKWHETQCLCGLTRDGQPATRLGKATVEVAKILRIPAPGATAFTVDATGLPYIVDVLAGGHVLNGTDSGPYDTETLGYADSALRAAFDEDDDITAAGWERVPDEESSALYRVTLPALPTP
ncbi:hypothetical protein [Streptomyces parvulus]|uniref:hypothetical protein n=1 Tax=Streptomyces parvulus TaxID=146923 RepID=UPI0037F266E9